MDGEADDPPFLADELFFDSAGLSDLTPATTLEKLSGVRSSLGPYPTTMIERAEAAWRTPLGALTFGQVLLLLGQDMGVAWLARPALAFARRAPTATVSFYPGDFALCCLQRAGPLKCAAPAELRDWLHDHFGWIDATFGWSRSMLREAEAALAEALKLTEHAGP